MANERDVQLQKALNDLLKEQVNLQTELDRLSGEDVSKAQEQRKFLAERAAESKKLLATLESYGDAVEAGLKKEIELLEKKIKKATESDKLNLEEIAALEQQKRTRQALSGLQESEIDNFKKNLETQVKIGHQTVKRVELYAESEEKLKRIGSQFGGILGFGVKLEDTIMGGIVGGLGAAGVQALKFMESLKEGDVSLKSMVEGAEKFGSGIAGGLVARIEEAVFSLDNQRSEFLLTTGATAEYSKSLLDVNEALVGMRLDASVSGEAMRSLYDNVTFFKDANKAARDELGIFVGTMMNAGVSADELTQSMQLMGEVFGYNESQIIAQSESLKTLGRELDISVNQLFSEFNQLMPELAAHGDDLANKVFADLRTQARATGVEVHRLMQIAGQFDTFEDSATAVGRLNGLLGGPYLNSVQMVYASEAERMKLMHEGFRNSGRAWADLERYEKKSLAAASGFESVAEAQMFFSNSLTVARRKMKEKEEADKEAAKMAKEAQTAQQKLTLAINSLINDAIKPLLLHLHTFADTVSNLIAGPVGKFVAVSLIAVSVLGSLVRTIAFTRIAFQMLGLSIYRALGFLGLIIAGYQLLTSDAHPLVKVLGAVAIALGAVSLAMSAFNFSSFSSMLAGLTTKFSLLGASASKTGMLMKGALLTGGAGMVANTMGGGPSVGGAFQGALGGAMTGFALGGPVGALIGGAVGIGASLFNEGGVTQPGVPFSIVGDDPDGKNGELRVDPPGARYFSAEKTKDLFGGSNGAMAETLNRISNTMDKIDKRDAKTQKTTGGRKVVATATINNQIDRHTFQKVVVQAIDDHGNISIRQRT